MKKLLGLGVVLTLALTVSAHAQQALTLDNLLPAGSGAASGQLVQLFGLLTVLSIAPGILIMVTSFTRFAIAFSLLRSGLGLQTAPASMVMISLALFMTFYV
ncbi:flagellar biosynthetic protein FliP, partial [Staphylococcus aureus]